MAGSRPEYVWCFDTHNATSAADPTNNPTNAVDIPTKMPRARFPALSVYLGTLEIPLPQYIVEKNWNTLYFDEGVRLVVNSPSEEIVRQFIVQLNGETITAIVPPLYNPIVGVNVETPTSPIFTTLYEHALDLRGQWNWGQPIQLIGTLLTNPQLIDLTQSNPNLVILSSNEFQLNNVPSTVSFQSSGSNFGYVHAPPIASPAYLASIVQAALNVVAPGEFQLTYNQTTTGRFFFGSVIPNPNTCVTDPGFQSVSLSLLIPSQNCLAAIMGFGIGNVPVPTGPVEKKSELWNKPPVCVSGLQGNFGYQCFSSIQVPPGNYSSDMFGNQLYLQWNRFVFDGGAFPVPNTTTNPVFVFSNSVGAKYSFGIPFGTYTILTFCQFLQDAMDSVDNTQQYNVIYQNNQVCFSSGVPFGLEFNDPTQTLNPQLLGFEALSYRGDTTYCSPCPFTVPTTNCCGTGQVTRYSSATVFVKLLSTQQKFQFSVVSPRTVTSANLSDQGSGTAELCSGYPTEVQQAHGLQVDDLVVVTVLSSGMTYLVRVLEVPSAFCVLVDSSSISEFQNGVPDLGVSFGLADLVPFSFLFADRCRTNRMSGSLLGFPNSDALFQSGTSPLVFVSPFNFNLEPPSYLLLAITDPHGSTHTNHAWNQDNLPNIFAKISCYPAFKLERNVPQIMYLSDLQQITKLRLTVLNPDHSCYQFHGRNWSGTLVFVAAEAQLSTVCF